MKKSNNIFSLALLIATMIYIMLVLSGNTFCKCIEHRVKKGETLFKIAEKYYGDGSLWREVRDNNGLKLSRVKVDQFINIYMPDEADWICACGHIIETRIKEKKINVDAEKIVLAIVNGIIDTESHDLIKSTPKEKLDFCRFALTTIEHESYFGEFFIGPFGEIGPWQFRLSTVRDLISIYNLNVKQSDKELVEYLLDEHNAAFLFILYFDYLYEKAHKNIWLTWRMYNGSGHHARQYAERIMDKYYEVRSIKVPCVLTPKLNPLVGPDHETIEFDEVWE